MRRSTTDHLMDAAGLRIAARTHRVRAKELARRVHALRRRLLDTTVLRGQFPIRRALAVERSQRPEAQARLERFAAASSAWAEVDTSDQALAGLTRVIEQESLSWWVPAVRPDDPRIVPYRVLTQTRELALGGLMIDIGANIGRMSIPRVILGDAIAAYCAEPDPLNYKCLVRTVRDNRLAGLVLPDQVAIGSADGTARLLRASTSSGHRVVERDGAASPDVIDVPAFTLDAWAARVGVDLELLTFVKVDAQGSEAHVLQGAHDVLRQRQVAWEMEVHPRLLARRGSGRQEYLGALAEHFTHFIDLNSQAPGPRVRPVRELDAALGSLWDTVASTHVLLFTLERAAQSS
jgi:FkbM family methyltransferase